MLNLYNIINHIIIIKFSPELEKKLIEEFNKIDTDNSGTIDKEETLKYWYFLMPITIKKGEKEKIRKKIEHRCIFLIGL